MFTNGLAKKLLSTFILMFSLSALAKPITLTLNWKPEPEFGGFYAAEVEGIFKKYGLDVVIQEGGSGTPTPQMLASMKTDFAIVSADEIVLAHARGSKNLVGIFATYQTAPYGIMTHQERNFKSLEDVLKSDGTLVWITGLPYTVYLSKKFGPVKSTLAPYQGGIGVFQNDKKVSQQCFVSSEPLLAKKAGLNVKTFLVADAGFNPYTAVLATHKKLLEKDNKKVELVVKAIREGWQAYLKNPDKTNAHMSKLNKAMSPEIFKESAEAQKFLVETEETKKSGLGTMTVDRWQILVEQLLDIGLIKTKMPATDLFKNY